LSETHQPAARPWWRRWYLVLSMLLLVAVVLVLATERAGRQRIGTDFHVFWQAGSDFAHGLPLYQRLPGARKFIYPPFAAQLFQVLAIFPLKTAAWLFYVASVGLVFVAVRLSRNILERLEPGVRHRRLPIILAVLFSLNFILDNLNLVQVNLLIFVLSLLGIRALVERRGITAGGWLTAATAIKITPVFLVIWAMIRGTRRTWAGAFGFGLLALVLPMVQRGFAQGLADLTTYYQKFLHEFAAGAVIAHYFNQNLASMIYRATVSGAAGDAPYDYAYLPSLAAAAPMIYRVLALTVLVVFLAHIIRLRVARRPIGPLEICSVFLASHLLSGITWKAHLVTLLFVSYTFFSLDRERMTKGARVALMIAWAGLGIIGLGRDVIGRRLHHYAGGYSVIVWVMLLLFTLSVVWSQKPVRGER
jgi:hypothetical protein